MPFPRVLACRIQCTRTALLVVRDEDSHLGSCEVVREKRQSAVCLARFENDSHAHVRFVREAFLLWRRLPRKYRAKPPKRGLPQAQGARLHPVPAREVGWGGGH